MASAFAPAGSGTGAAFSALYTAPLYSSVSVLPAFSSDAVGSAVGGVASAMASVVGSVVCGVGRCWVGAVVDAASFVVSSADDVGAGLFCGVVGSVGDCRLVVGAVVDSDGFWVVGAAVGTGGCVAAASSAGRRCVVVSAGGGANVPGSSVGGAASGSVV